MTRNPTISIIIPTHNRESLIPFSIDSVLRQTCTDWELLIVDDASTDGTARVVEKYLADPRIRYIRQAENQGISRTRNHGLQEARGTYVAMLDSDDIWIDQEKLAKQIAAFDANPKLGIVGTWMTAIDETGKTLQNISFAEKDADIRKNFLYKNHIMQSSVLFLKQAAVDAGGYDETLATMEDHDLWLNIATKYEVETLPSYALGYRIHPQSITKNRRAQIARDELFVIRRWRNSYPGFVHGTIKGYIRLLLAYFGR